MKIRIDLCVHFSYNLPDKTALGNDTSQTKIFNFFPGSIQALSIIRILSSFASRYKHNYIPHRNLWINRLYFEISNSTQKQCLTIDTRDFNDLGPARFRTQADSDTGQICYYNRNKRDTIFNSFLEVRKETSFASEITFAIVKVIDKTNRNDIIYSEISDELSDFKNDITQRTIQQTSESDTVRKTTDRKRPNRRQHTRHRRVSKKPRFLSG